MLLTKDEAKKKGCPYKPMAYVTLGNAGEPVPQWIGFDVCSGSECMAWREKIVKVEEKSIPHPMTQKEITLRWRKLDMPPPDRPSEVPEDYTFELHSNEAFWVRPEQTKKCGYCGLAGRVTE